MKIAPPKRTMKPRPVALVIPGWRHLLVETLDGVHEYQGAAQCYEAFAGLAGWAVYLMGGITQLRHTTGAKVWEGKTWRGRCTSMTLDGTKTTVMSVRGALEGTEDPYGELLRALSWFGDYGVPPGGISGMGWALWRATLKDEITISASPALGRRALFGGRQGLREARTFQHVAAVDLVGAYPHSMAAAPYAAGLRKVAPTTTLDPKTPGIVEASIGVDPTMPFGPVPRRLAPDMIDFPTGLVTGRWAWCEVAAAKDLGCPVEVHKVWAPTQTLDLFNAQWVMAVTEARALGGGAGKFAKNCINATWGIFGMSSDLRTIVRWSDDAGLVQVSAALPETALPHAAASHTAAETAARVRVRMLLEGLYGDWPVPYHHDTDGIMVRQSAVRKMPTEAPPGEWRVKGRHPRVEFRAPQVFRATCLECEDPTSRLQTHRRWHYTTAGCPASLAEHLFNKVGPTGSLVSFNGQDCVVPRTNTYDHRSTRAAIIAARSQIGALQNADG